MKAKKWYIVLSLALVLSSIITYLLQNAIFHKSEDTFFYMMQDLAFVPVQVLLVMLIIDRLLQRKEKEALLHKMNMVVGVYFNEMGRDLISQFIEVSGSAGALRAQMLVAGDWDDNRFMAGKESLKHMNYDLQLSGESLEEMREFLCAKRELVLRLLENPNLLEHESFTDLLWAVCHLSDELMHRSSLSDLPQPDMDHLKGDITRAFRLLNKEWLEYMQHLKKSYPYLYSLAVRINPFNTERSAVIY
jgi:hypothetical protein